MPCYPGIWDVGKGCLFHSVIQDVGGEGAQLYPVRQAFECHVQGSAETEQVGSLWTLGRG